MYGSVASWATFITDAALDAARVGADDPPYWALTGSGDPPPPGGGGDEGQVERCHGGDDETLDREAARLRR